MGTCLEFNYDISCPFAYIASTRVESLAARTSADLTWRPVLLGAIYRATSAPQGAGGSASDLHNPTKRAVGAKSMARTLRRYAIEYNPPPQHPRKTVNALRLLHAIEGDDRRKLTKALFRAYWVQGRDVSNDDELIRIAEESGIARRNFRQLWTDTSAKKALEAATGDAIERGAFGVPGFWIPEARWTNNAGEEITGRFFWGQDRMHFVEATLQSLKSSWADVPELGALMPRTTATSQVHGKVKLEFWYDFSSPWAFLGWTQLARMQRMFPNLEIVMKPFLLGILFREIGAPNLPMAAVSATKANWSRQDHADWTAWWNAVNAQEGAHEKNIDFHWNDIFPIRTPTVLRVAMVEPETVAVLYRACWEENKDMANDDVLKGVLDKAGYEGAELITKANSAHVKARLRQATGEAKAAGICGVPSYRVVRQRSNNEWVHEGGIVWGQDELNVVQDLIAGWDAEASTDIAEPRKSQGPTSTNTARL